MRVCCLASYASLSSREQLWQLIQYKQGWIGDRYTHTLFWIPEPLVPLALLIDSDLEARPKLDYII